MPDPICPPDTPFAATVDSVRSGERRVEQAVAGLLDQLSDDELLWLLDGDVPLRSGLLSMAKRYNEVPYEAGRIDRLGIPGIRFTDGPRGVVAGSCTSFPVAIARAATFDPELERRVGAAIGSEARAQGANLFAGICVNLAYSPGWGRSQESYGEDPLVLGTMGAALSDGAAPSVLTCVKHFALNSMEEGRFRVDVRVADDVMHEVYLPHFRAIVESGVDAVMSAYNSVNGTWAGENPQLLTTILRHEWGFAGFVMSDFVWGLRHPVESVAAGQDLEMPFRPQRAATLPGALADGRLDRADVRRAALRLLSAQVRLALRARPDPGPALVASPVHRLLARGAASRGAVLLRNATVDGRPALPLAEPALHRLAVLGPGADQANQGDVASSRVYPPQVVTVLDGLRARLGARAVHVPGNDPALAAAAARSADAAVVVVGLTPRDEGESLIGVDTAATQLLGGLARFRPVAAVLGRVMGWAARRRASGGDRRDLRLHAVDVALIRAVSAANPRTVVVVMCGGTVVVDPWDRDATAVLIAWYPGMEGGHAIADLLFGHAEPTGRLPVAVPHRQQDLPQLDWDARSVTYGRWWGQRKLDHDGVAAAYPFGFGLGYTTFSIADLAVMPAAGETFAATVDVSNTGSRSGRHVVQVYARSRADGPDAPGAPAAPGRSGQAANPGSGGFGPGRDRPRHPDGSVRSLVGFQAVELAAGATTRLTIRCSLRPLQGWTGASLAAPQAPPAAAAPPLSTLAGPAGTILVEAASYSGDPAALITELELWPVPRDAFGSAPTTTDGRGPRAGDAGRGVSTSSASRPSNRPERRERRWHHHRCWISQRIAESVAGGRRPPHNQARERSSASDSRRRSDRGAAVGTGARAMRHAVSSRSS